MKILITGANGYIGKSLYNTLKDTYDVFVITTDDCDLTNSVEVNSYFIDKWFCPECYEEETQVQCYYCEETLQNGNDVVLNSENESCCVACYVAVSCCPNKHYGGQYGCDFCPPVKCDWGCNDCRGKSDKGFCYKYEKKDTYELTSFVRENKNIFKGIYCPIKHYRMFNYETLY